LNPQQALQKKYFFQKRTSKRPTI